MIFFHDKKSNFLLIKNGKLHPANGIQPRILPGDERESSLPVFKFEHLTAQHLV